MLPSIGELNDLDEAAAASALAPLFEGAPRLVRRLVADRPYGSYVALLDRAHEIALGMPDHEQVELIDSHPRIGAPPATVSAQSYREQGYDRPDSGDGTVHAALERLNSEYEARFGFRFVIYVADRPRSAIVPIIEERLTAEREAEKARALGDVIAIARGRAGKLSEAEERA